MFYQVLLLLLPYHVSKPWLYAHLAYHPVAENLDVTECPERPDVA